MFERIIQKQLSFYIKHFFSPCLCGYRKGFSTQFALISLNEKWRKYFDNKGYTGAVSMDLSKAFNTTNYELLMAKYMPMGLAKIR